MQVPSDKPALRSHIELQLDFMNEFSKKSYDTLRQLSEMHLKLARQTIEGSLHSSRDMLSCTDPAQLAQAAIKQMEPASERLRAYQQHLVTLLSGAQAALAQAAETGLPEVSRSASAAAEEMVRHAAVAANVPASGPTGAQGKEEDKDEDKDEDEDEDQEKEEAPRPPPSPGNGSGEATPRAS